MDKSTLRTQLRRPNRWYALISLIALIALLDNCNTLSHDNATTTVAHLDGSAVRIAQMEGEIAAIMDKAAIPGLSMAIINDYEIVYTKGFGLRSNDTTLTIGTETIMGAASFSKTVFSYLVMSLAKDGLLDLDTPLYLYFAEPLYEHPRYTDLADDDRYKLITARMVLSHTTGFPNWRFLTDDGKLSILSDPGTKYGYSGEGIALLQRVVENLTGQTLETQAQEKIFKPLKMTKTSYVWQSYYDENYAYPHDRYARARDKGKRTQPDAAGSMQTTATDYARFLIQLLSTDERPAPLGDAMFEKQISITSPFMFGPRSREDSNFYSHINLGWSLGFGWFKTDNGRAIFHTGHDFGYQNYTVTYVDRGIGVILLCNSDNFESVADELVAATIGDTESPFRWLGYPQFDPNMDRTPPAEPTIVEVPTDLLRTYVGKYDFQGETTITVELRDADLWITTDGQEWTQLLPITQSLFMVKSDNTRFQFGSENGSEIDIMFIVIEGLQLPAPRIQ